MPHLCSAAQQLETAGAEKHTKVWAFDSQMLVVPVDWLLPNSPLTARTNSFHLILIQSKSIFPDEASQEVSVADPTRRLKYVFTEVVQLSGLLSWISFFIGGNTKQYLRVPVHTPFTWIRFTQAVWNNKGAAKNIKLFYKQFHIWHIGTKLWFRWYIYSLNFDSNSVNVCDHKQAASIFTKQICHQRFVLTSKSQFSH